jgi:hypothetical protein
LERKSKPIFDLLEQTNHDWGVVLSLAKNFGLRMVKSFKIAQSIPFQFLERKF